MRSMFPQNVEDRSEQTPSYSTIRPPRRSVMMPEPGRTSPTTPRMRPSSDKLDVAVDESVHGIAIINGYAEMPEKIMRPIDEFRTLADHAVLLILSCKRNTTPK